MMKSRGHIEFLGPPGVGKTAIHSGLISYNHFYGGVREGALQRKILTNVNRKYEIVYRLMPNILQKLISKWCFKHRLKRTAIEQFITNHPDYVKKVAAAMESVTYEPQRIYTMCIVAGEHYQLGISTMDDNEILCLDEGFAQKVLSILWREPDKEFAIGEFLQSVPKPKLLIHVDAPTKVCLRRQRQRGSSLMERDWESQETHKTQQKLRDRCFQISDYIQENMSASVVRINNTDTIESAVSKVKREI